MVRLRSCCQFGVFAISFLWNLKKREVKTEMIKATVHILNMFNFSHSGNKMEQKFGPDAWTANSNTYQVR